MAKAAVAVQHSRVSGSGGIQPVPGTKWSESQTALNRPRRASRLACTPGSHVRAGAPAGSHMGRRQPKRRGASRPLPGGMVLVTPPALAGPPSGAGRGALTWPPGLPWSPRAHREASSSAA